MKVLPVGELKAHFAKVLESVKQGEEFVISYGKKRENIAVIIPYKEYKERNRIKLGLLAKKGTYKINHDFKMTAEELFEV
jgi:prevent-host-death family protein